MEAKWGISFVLHHIQNIFSLNNKSSLSIDIFFNQVQVGGKKNSVILQKLTHDTPYSITVAAVYRTGESKDISGQGKTSKWLQRESFQCPEVF